MRDKEIQPPLLEVVWKDSEKENCMASESVALVDVPVTHGKERMPLANITNSENYQGVSAKEKGGRKWKRLAPNSGKRQGDSVQNRESGSTDGLKRTWKMRDECKEVSVESDLQ